MLQIVCDRNYIRNNYDVVDFFPQNLKIPRVSSAYDATLAARALVEALKHPTPNAHFAKINDTNHIALRNFAELFNLIPKLSEQQSTNRHIERRSEVENKPEQSRAQVIHKYPTRQHQKQAPTPRVNTNKRRPGRPPRVETSDTHMEIT